MPLVRWIFAILVALFLVPASAGAIVNGSFDGDAHPYVGIAVAGDDFCSGSLVSSTLFVTAGHCTAAFGHDVGVVVLDTAVELPRYASLPRLGALGADLKASFTLAGYGANGWVTGGGRPFPTFDFDRMVASSQLIGVATQFARFSTNPGQDDGGIGPGDSGGPALRTGTDVVSAIGSHGPSRRATGNVYFYRLDTSDARSFLGRFTALP
jgi:hypothetical protein